MVRKKSHSSDNSRISGEPDGIAFEVIIYERNDWAVVVKAHAFIDFIVICLLEQYKHTVSIKKEKIINSYIKSRSFENRLQMAVLLNLVPDVYIDFITGIQQLRNKLAHNARFVDFKFDGCGFSKLKNYIEMIDIGIEKILERKSIDMNQDVSFSVVAIYKRLVQNDFNNFGYLAGVMPRPTVQATATQHSATDGKE
jgi:hypothetical protein